MIIPLVSKLQEDGMWDAMGCHGMRHRIHASLMYSSAPNLSAASSTNGVADYGGLRTGIHWDPVPERVEPKVSNHVRTSGVIPGEL
jgi:hypothetical protein